MQRSVEDAVDGLQGGGARRVMGAASAHVASLRPRPAARCLHAALAQLQLTGHAWMRTHHINHKYKHTGARECKSKPATA